MSDEQNYDQNAQNEEAMESQQTDAGGDGAANGDGSGENDDDRFEYYRLPSTFLPLLQKSLLKFV